MANKIINKLNASIKVAVEKDGSNEPVSHFDLNPDQSKDGVDVPLDCHICVETAKRNRIVVKASDGYLVWAVSEDMEGNGNTRLRYKTSGTDSTVGDEEQP